MIFEDWFFEMYNIYPVISISSSVTTEKQLIDELTEPMLLIDSSVKCV